MSTYPGTAGRVYTMLELYELLEADHCPPDYLLTMAAIPMFEAGGVSNALNNNPGTHDFSVGEWQINYFGDLLAERTTLYGPPEELAESISAQAKAAVSILGGGPGITAWAGDPVGQAAIDAGRGLTWPELLEILGAHGVDPSWYAGMPPASPPPDPTPESETEMIGALAADPISGGVWITNASGAVYAIDGAPYLASLKDHPDFDAGDSSDPCIGIAYWQGGANLGDEANGYYLATWKAGASEPSLYRFPRNGSLVPKEEDAPHNQPVEEQPAGDLPATQLPT
jgi:hypothetical protein